MESLTKFDELLDLAARKGPFEFEVKALGGKKVFLRDPSSADVDEWRMHCSRARDRNEDVPYAAKLCQIMLCDAAGERLVPQTPEALEALADGDSGVINEIADLALKLISDPTDEEVEAIQKN